MRLVKRLGGAVRRPHSWCTSCRSLSTSRAPSHVPKKAYPIWHRECVQCGRAFVARFGFQVTCGPGCRDARRKAKDRAASAARYAGAKQARFDPRTIFARDGWRCHICGELADTTTATLDHIIPVAHGGPHDPANVATAHGVCNSRRGATVRRVAK